MAENPQRPQERIDELIRRIGNDSEAYTTSVQQLQTGFNRRNTDLFDMLAECMRIANEAIDLVLQNTGGNTVAIVQQRLQELERAYNNQNTQVAGDFRELLQMVNTMQTDGVQGTAPLRQQLEDIRRRLEQAQAQERAVAGLPPQPPGVGGYGNNKRKPKKKHHGGYAYPGSPNKSYSVSKPRKVNSKNKTRRRKRSLAGKRVSSKSQGRTSGPSKRSTRRRRSRR
tara:strand:- start:777 stop:1454 length:678 start_codon:yes stop_codon:yes gene_type:complete